jgi:hypothetical protein
MSVENVGIIYNVECRHFFSLDLALIPAWLLTTVRHVQVKQGGLKFNGTYQLVVCADYVNLFDKNRHEV